jgi:hypothetical protein
MFAEEFADRVLPFDGAAAEVFASIVAGRRQVGRPMSAFDGQIAAITIWRGAGLATRNISDFEDCGLILSNPWQS